MIKGIVIGASKDAIHTIEKAKEHGIYVIALDGNPNAEGFEVADEKVVVDISDLEKVRKEVDRINPDFKYQYQLEDICQQWDMLMINFI